MELQDVSFRKGIPYLGVLVLIEYIVLLLQGKPRPRINDTVTSLSLGLLQECARLVCSLRLSNICNLHWFTNQCLFQGLQCVELKQPCTSMYTTMED